MAGKDLFAPPTKDELAKVTSSDMFAPPSKEELGVAEQPSLLERAGQGLLSGVTSVGRFVDRYSGAPTRSAMGAIQKGENPIPAFGKQFGEDPSLAPTGKDLAANTGLSTEENIDVPGVSRIVGKVSPAGIAGLGLDIAADPINLIPGRAIGKAAELVGEGASAIARPIGRGAAKLAGEVSGINPKNIETYAKNLREINSNIGKYGKDTATAADDIRDKALLKAKDFRQAEGAKISEALKAASPDKSVDISKVRDKLISAAKDLHPVVDEKDISEIADLVAKIDKIAPMGMASAQDAHAIQRMLRDAAAPTYQQFKNGQLFPTGKYSQVVAKQGAGVARAIVNEAVPEVAKANTQLARLHDIEDVLQRNLLKKGATDTSLTAAGGGANPRNLKALQSLDSRVGSTIASDAEKLSAQKAFTDPEVLSKHTTGKSALGVAGAYMLGGAKTAGVGLVLSSPAAIKTAINAGNMTKKIAQSVLPSLKDPKSIDLIRAYLATGKLENTQSKNQGLLK